MASLFISKRELARAWQITKVIGRYGLAPLAQFLGLDRLPGIRFRGRMARQYQHASPPVRLRLALTELGTTFIKLGQVLSARSDLLPPDYINELSKLQDDVPALPFNVIEPVFRASFGYSPFETFATFDPQPIASASIGQAYRATLSSGEDVVVKIQRPGVEAQVTTDLSLLRRVAEFASRNERIRRFDLPELVREFSAILQDELIYTLEAYNAEAFTNEMADHPEVIFPVVYWPYTSRQVLTTGFIDGFKVTDLLQLDEAGIDRSRVAATLANNILEQILLQGLFHGDPHPGNLLVTPDGKLAFLDTGMVGRFDRKMRELLIELAISIFDQDIDAILEHLQQIGIVEEVSSLPDLRRDLARLITKYYFLPRKELRLGELLQRVNFLLFEHQIRMAYEFGLMTKALFLAEGVARELDPNFDYNEAARPVIAEIRRRYYSPQTFFEDTLREFRGLRRQIVDLPRRLSTVLSQLESGTIHVRQVDELNDLKQEGRSILVNRASFSLLVASLLLASVWLLSMHQTGWLHYAGIVGLAIDIFFGILLLVAFLRTGSI